MCLSLHFDPSNRFYAAYEKWFPLHVTYSKQSSKDGHLIIFDKSNKLYGFIQKGLHHISYVPNKTVRMYVDHFFINLTILVHLYKMDYITCPSFKQSGKNVCLSFFHYFNNFDAFVQNSSHCIISNILKKAERTSVYHFS